MDELMDIEEISLKVKSATSMDVALLKKSVDELTESIDTIIEEKDNIVAAKNELADISDKMDDAIAASVTASNAATSATEAANKAEEAKAEAANSAEISVTAANISQQNVLTANQYAYSAKQSEQNVKAIETNVAKMAEDAKKAEENAIAAAESVSLELATDYAKKSEIPTIPTNVSEFVNDAGYLTSHQDLSNYVTGTNLEDALSTLDLSSKQDVITDLETIRTGAAAGATAIQEHQDLSAYATKDELPDISGLATKDELATAGKVKTVNGIEPDDAGNIEIEAGSAPNLNAGYDNGNLTLGLKTDQFIIENVGGELIVSPVDGGSIIVAGGGGGFKPTPEQLENLNTDHSQFITEHQDLSGYATKDEIPDISGKADRSEIPDISGKANTDDVYDKNAIDSLFGDVDAILTQLGVDVE